MDVKLLSLRQAFADAQYQRSTRNFRVFMFILATPSDLQAFEELLRGFEDLHHLTGDDILVIGPAVTVQDKIVTREELSRALRSVDQYSREQFDVFRDRQSSEVYDFCRHIGLPAARLPCLAFFETLARPDKFACLDLPRDPSVSLVGRVREAMSHLSERCKWREAGQLRRLQGDLASLNGALEKSDWSHLPYFYPEITKLRDAFLRDSSQLETYRKQLERPLDASADQESKARFQASVVDLRREVEAHLLPHMDSEKGPRTIDVLQQLGSDQYNEPAINHVRMLRQNHKSKLTEHTNAIFNRFFEASDRAFRADRLGLSISLLVAKDEKNVRRLREAIDSVVRSMQQAKTKIEHSLLSAAAPIAALGELEQSGIWKVVGSSQSGEWFVQESDVSNERGERIVVGREVKRVILFLASNPVGTDPLRLDEEVREIDAGLRRASLRDRFELKQKWAVRADDLRRGLLDEMPSIVHFSGHGSGTDGLVFEASNGAEEAVRTEALAQLFALCANHVECVVLNACYSEVQAAAIARHIPFVIGMGSAIGDRAAIKFAVGLYDALAAGRSYEDAFQFGRNAIDLSGIPEQNTPQLRKKH